MATTTARGDCKLKPEGAFAGVWQSYQNRLGCPQTKDPRGGYFAEQPFENGYMFWYSIFDMIFVTIAESERNGWWEVFTKEQTDAYYPSDTGSCTLPVPEGVIQPIRGFGAVWCGRDDIRAEIGFATAKEFGTVDALIQEFENGIIFQDSRKRIFVLFTGQNATAGNYEIAQ